MKNNLIETLGYEKNDRVVVFHCDDIGVCQSSIPAYTDLLDFGLISSASVMVPCPWFPEVAKLCREHPGLDMGVHLTMTCEWQSYRWAPISTVDPASGLLDADGYMHRDEYKLWRHCSPDFVEQEAYAQVNRALQAGIDVSHLDSHMFSMLSAKTLPVLHKLAQEYRLPLLAFHPNHFEQNPGLLNHFNMAQEAHSLVPEYPSVMSTSQKMAIAGLPLFDRFVSLSYTDAKDRVYQVKQILTNLQPGVTFFMLHPAIDSPELRAICPGVDADIRVADYKAFLSKQLKQFVKQQGIQVVSFKELRALARQE